MSRVPFYIDWMGSLLDVAPGFLKGFGRLESKLLEFDIAEHSIDRPVFISGLARSGTTILLEMLNDHPDVTSYQYRDYPFVHVNYFWNTVRGLIPSNPNKVERAHQDRIMINAESPEALDEILLMSFFDGLHDPKVINTMDIETSNPGFEKFYKNSLLKLLALRKAKRLALKNNYHIARLPYLHKLFPDAKFVIPVRSPENHIASMLKQHALLKREQQNDPRGIRYMRRHGHHEFGRDFRPVNFGDSDAVTDEWNRGETLKAYAIYWAQTHEFIHKTLKDNPALKKCCLIVNYDALCTAPKDNIERIMEFCDLDGPGLIDRWSEKISAPDYYESDFTKDERKTIKDATASVYKKLT